MDTIKESRLFQLIEIIVTVFSFLQMIVAIWGVINNLFNSPIAITIIAVQLIEIFMLLMISYKIKCKLSLIESLENNGRSNLISAVQMFLNKDKNANSFRINKATLDVSIINNEKTYSEMDLCDLEFRWVLECENTTSKNIDKFYFRLGTISATSLQGLNINTQEIVARGGDEFNYIEMEKDQTAIIDKSNMFIIPYIFKEKKPPKKSFCVKTSYICPSCFIQKQDWLIMAPFNFSKQPLKKFEINVHCDEKVIKKDKYYIRLYSLLINSPMHREMEGIVNFEYINKGIYTSGVIDVDPKYIYIAEINRRDV